MDAKYLDVEFNRFFEPREGDATSVPYTDAKLFAEHIAKPLEVLVEQLTEGLIECRSSVMFDLNRYERLALDYGRLGAEGKQTHDIAEAEANRLRILLDRIDAIQPPGTRTTNLHTD